MLLASLTLWFWVPLAWIETVPLCWFHYWTGLDCPGCGLTRAFYAMFHGQWRRVFEYNALAPVLLLWFWILLADSFYSLVKKRRPLWYSAGGAKLISLSFGILLFGQWFYKLYRLLS